jgi:hypothetical protein
MRWSGLPPSIAHIGLATHGRSIQIGSSLGRALLVKGRAQRKAVRFAVLFMGDSTTAGFEVNDDETFVSEINRDCKTTHITGANFGVRAYNTHRVIANYGRIASSTA